MDDILCGKKVHFIGVGGISMSALIRIAKKLGAVVSGSDRSESETFRTLLSEGFDVYVGERAERAAEADLVVYNAAIKEDNAELLAAGGKAITRAAFLAEICDRFDRVIAVAGTHGKTTVSAMIACAAAAGGSRFSAHIGGVVRNFASNTFLAGKELFVTEACEYKNSFLTLSPDIAIVLNIEEDHSDFFADLQAIERSFDAFLSRVRSGGAIILGAGVPSRIPVCANEHIRIYRYGEDFFCERTEEGGLCLRRKNQAPFYFSTPAKGSHNVYNAGVAAFASLLAGISEDGVRMGLGSFLGVKRRYEYMGNTQGGAAVVHDYAHHPSEIEAVMKVSREETKGRVILVFEPHTYSRTKALFEDFARVLSAADIVVMLPTYSAREVPAEGVDAETLFYALTAKERYYFRDYESAKTLLDRIARSRDQVLILGAGRVEELAARFRKKE